MLTGATSLDLVRDELFASIDEVERLLQQFLDQRDNGSLLQHAIEGLQQLRGTLALIQLEGAVLLLEEMIALATDTPLHQGEERDAPLSALCNGLFLLHRYLQLCRKQGSEFPELLLPTINELRSYQSGVAPLPESHFYPLDKHRVPVALRDGTRQLLDPRTFARLRQMYQLGLLAMIRDDHPAPGIIMMQRALQRMETRLDDRAATLCWVAAAALEAVTTMPLELTSERKRLYARVDRKLRRLFNGSDPGPIGLLLCELLYVVALADSRCVLCEEVRKAFNLPDLGYTVTDLERAFDQLRGPGSDVMRTVAEVLHEEIRTIKDLLDLLARNAGDAEQSLESLVKGLQRLWKTLSMLNMHDLSVSVRTAVTALDEWQSGDSKVLEQVADVILEADLLVTRMANEDLSIGSLSAEQADAPVELKEAHIVLVEESQAGLALARRALVAYVESDSDRMHLLNVPDTLESVRGGLIFLGMERAAQIISKASRFIRETMLEGTIATDAHELDVLADALTSVEFYLESVERSSVSTGDVLALAEESLAELGYAVGA